MDTSGERCIRSLTQALWYADPHHKQLANRSIKFPEVFASFQVGVLFIMHLYIKLLLRISLSDHNLISCKVWV